MKSQITKIPGSRATGNALTTKHVPVGVKPKDWLAPGEAAKWSVLKLGRSGNEKLFPVSGGAPDRTRREASAFDRSLVPPFAGSNFPLAAAPRPAHGNADMTPPNAQYPPVPESGTR